MCKLSEESDLKGGNMNIKADVLEKRIEELPEVCEDTKKAIKKLFEDSFGVEFEKKSPPKVGGVWRTGKTVFVIGNPINNSISIDQLSLSGLEVGDDKGPLTLEKYLADSPEEYFRKKFNKEL